MAVTAADPEAAYVEKEPVGNDKVPGETPAATGADVEARWVAVSVCSHLAWGLHPVFVRYMQVVCGLEGLVAVSCCFLLALLLIQLTLRSGFGGCHGFRVGGLYSLVTLGRVVTQTLAAKYTQVLYMQLITQLGPFVTAFLSRVILGEDLPRYFCCAVFVCTCGAVMTILGQTEVGPGNMGVSREDGLGIGLSFVSVFFSAGMRIYMKFSSAKLSEEVLISWQYTNAIPMLGLAYLLLDDTAWERWLHLTPQDAGRLVAFTLLIALFANFSQVASVRRLGPSLAASIQPLRLVSTILGAYLALSEPVQSRLAWAGITVIFVTLVLFLREQFQPAKNAVPAKPQEPCGEKGKVAIQSSTGKQTRYGRLPEP